jgi:hypothetical protein
MIIGLGIVKIIVAEKELELIYIRNTQILILEFE